MSDTDMRLQGDREIIISRTFNAPARLVFDAMTKPELVTRWWAPKSHGVTMAQCEIDLRVGGKYRYVIQQGKQLLAFSGTYFEIDAPKRIVLEEIFEPMASAGAVHVTITLDEHDGKTRMVNHSVYPSKATRDAVLATGMEHGMREALDQLDELVSTHG